MKPRFALSVLTVFLALILVPALTVGAAALQGLKPVSEPLEAADFSLVNLNGETVQLSDFEGQVVMVNFWATWCPPCRYEIPSMRRAWEKMQRQNVMMLAIHVGGKEGKIKNFVRKNKMDFPVLFDANSEVYKKWPTGGYPSTFIVNPQGKIVYQAIGGRQWDAPEILDVIFGLQTPT